MCSPGLGSAAVFYVLQLLELASFVNQLVPQLALVLAQELLLELVPLLALLLEQELPLA